MSRYAVAKPYALPVSLGLLAGPTTGTIVLPRHIDWGPHYAFDLALPVVGRGGGRSVRPAGLR